MAIRQINTGLLQFYDPNTGKPVGNGYVSTYDTVSGSPKVTYQDIDGSVENPNPVPLDSTGSAYIFGEGSFKFVIKNAAGVIVRTIENIGIRTDSGYDVDEDTALLQIGGGNSGYDSGDYLPIYSSDEPHELIGFGAIDELVLQANVDNGTLAGDYNTVNTLYSSSSAAVPDGTLVFDGPQSGYQPESTRAYEFKGEGSFAVDPQADTNVSEWGEGDNYKDLLRFAAAEEMRVKRTPMYWDKCKNLIGQQTIEYPIIVIGSNSKFYVTSGSPTAEQMATTDPVTDTTSTVWTYVYDPTETAQYPPWYRSKNQGIDYNNTGSISIYPQSCKLLEWSVGTTYLFTNDGNLEETFYKDLGAFELGAGTGGSPKGAYYDEAGTPSAGWHNVWMIKSTGDLVDICLAPVNISLKLALAGVNANTAEVAAGRTWSYGRRIAYVYVASATTFREFSNSGDGFYTHGTTFSDSPNSATHDISVYCPDGQVVLVHAIASSGAEDTIFEGYLRETFTATNYQGYVIQKAGSYFAQYGSSGQFRIKTDTSGQVAFTHNGNGSWTVYYPAWQDLYED